MTRQAEGDALDNLNETLDNIRHFPSVPTSTYSRKVGHVSFTLPERVGYRRKSTADEKLSTRIAQRKSAK